LHRGTGPVGSTRDHSVVISYDESTENCEMNVSCPLRMMLPCVLLRSPRSSLMMNNFQVG
jgi:hypothetical protein